MSQQVGLILDPCFERHDTGPGHPERPERLRTIREALEQGLADRCRRLPLESADDELIALVHDREHIRRVDDACSSGATFIDSMDTAICPESAGLARLAAGSLTALCREVAAGRLARGFAAMRPPGHHAERDVAMGFCLFNNVAVAARSLCEREGLERVLIVDWDVHHGNGTQHLFEEDPRVFFFSLHQWPLYPGTGAREETGRGAGKGTTLNCPLPPGAGDHAFLGSLREKLIPAAEAFAPQMILISAGFDAHSADPLGGLDVSTAAYGEATSLLLDLARRTCGGKLVSTLEGGYDLDALADSVSLHLSTMLEA
ncbi:MAG: histone deacetylase [bacterium]|nr:histone deacetylase [bacterium]